jgi:hypothetical protein
MGSSFLLHIFLFDKLIFVQYGSAGMLLLLLLLLLLLQNSEARGGVVVEALRYKLEGRGFDSRWRPWIFY